MKQISTGTGLIVLSGTILASVFLSSPHTASTAFASTQQAQPAERSVGRKPDAAASVARSGDCELRKEIWFNTQQPREFQLSECVLARGVNASEYGAVDINKDGKCEFIYPPSGVVQVVQDSHGVAFGDSLISSKIILTAGDPSVEYFSVLDLPSNLGEYFVQRFDVTQGWFQFGGWTDCDGDNDLDLIYVFSGARSDGVGFDLWGWLENTGFQHTAPLEGDLNHDGQVDNADVGVLLLNFDA